VRLEERARMPTPQGAVTVSIRAASLNHLDVWLVSGAQRVEPPRVLAADGAGVVAESGDSSWRPGDEVVIYPVACCWRCEQCRAGRQVFCPQFGILGEHTDGTACEFFQVPAQNLYRRPEGLTWDEAAAFPLTFLTAWRMIVTRARLQPGETMLVVGAGAGVAAAAIAIGVPGWPEFAACTASIARVRIVFTLSESSAGDGGNAVVASMNDLDLLLDSY